MTDRPPSNAEAWDAGGGHVSARLAPEVIAAIRERYVAGVPLKIIEDEVGVDLGLVLKYTRDLPRRFPAHEARRQRILTLANEGKDPRAIATALGCTIGVVVLALRPPPPSPEELAAEAERKRLAKNARQRAYLARRRAEEERAKTETPPLGTTRS